MRICPRIDSSITSAPCEDFSFFRARMPCLTIVGQCRGLLHDSAAPWAKHAVTWLRLPAAKQDLSKADSPRQWVAAIYFITMTITTVSGIPV